MMLLHFLQRILKTLPLTLSSAIEYFAEQASQTIFIGSYLCAWGRVVAGPSTRRPPLGLGEKMVSHRNQRNGSRSTIVWVRSGPTETSDNGVPIQRSIDST